MLEALSVEQRRLLRLVCEGAGYSDERRVIVALLDILDMAERYAEEMARAVRTAHGAVDLVTERCERLELAAETWSARALEAEAVIGVLTEVAPIELWLLSGKAGTGCPPGPRR